MARRFLLVVTAWTTLVLSTDPDSSSSPVIQNRTTVLAAEDEDQDPHAIKIRRLIGPVDQIVVDRYKKVPTGFRKHPSYYSERYLRRARTYKGAEKDKLDQWGKWEFQDPDESSRPGNAFYDDEKYTHRDVPRKDFPKTAWQTDKKYLSKFLPEALQLTNRALEAILAEYGRGKDDMPGASFDERSAPFQPRVGDQGSGGGGYMKPSSYEGLKRRIWHAVMTEDRFTFAMAGHSAAAGHGNNFQQSYTLQIGRICEPIFARLGVKFSARNFGYGGLGTLQNALASADIFGHDVDCLLWDSSMTEKAPEAIGILAIQALIAMDRAPFLWFTRDQQLNKIQESTGADTARYGSPRTGKQVEDPAEFSNLPWAIQYDSCPKDMKRSPMCSRWIGSCWENRTNFEWEGIDLSYVAKKQQAAPGGRAGWHPGNREHQKQGRSFAFTVLLALRDVLEKWNKAPDYVVSDSDWHVTAYYKGIKDKVAEKSALWTGWCDKQRVSKKFCMYAAKGRTENTPRNRPWATSIRSIISGSEHPNLKVGKNAYDPPDVYIPALHPPKGQVDVLAIVENGVPFRKNLARVYDSDQDMEGIFFEGKEGTGSIHNKSIAGGKGWQFFNTHSSTGTDNCDGEHDSWCRRVGGCLLYAHNDLRTGFGVDGYSGWMIFNLTKVEHGLVLLKFHTWSFGPPGATSNWCSENNETPCQPQTKGKHRALSSSSKSSIPTNVMSSMDNTTVVSLPERRLKGKVPAYCDDFRFEFAIDGAVTSWNFTQFRAHKNYAQRVVELVTVLDEDHWPVTRDVEVAFRLTGCGRQKPFELTHVYWI